MKNKDCKCKPNTELEITIDNLKKEFEFNDSLFIGLTVVSVANFFMALLALARR